MNRRNDGNAAYKARVKSLASSRETPSLCARPASPWPYRSPYTVVLAFARSARVTGADAGKPRPAFQMRSNASADDFLSENLEQSRVARETRQHAQLDLRVVRREEHAPLGRDERAAERYARVPVVRADVLRF